MVIKCISNTGSFSPLVLPEDLSKPLADDNFAVGQPGITTDGKYRYNISIGTNYTVWGIVSYAGVSRYLILDDDNGAELFPAKMFCVIEDKMNVDWRATHRQIGEESLLLIGYDEFVTNHSHMVGLMNREPIAIKVLLDYKAFCEKYQLDSI